MITFSCDRCTQLVFFDNTSCTRCGTDLVLDPATWTMRSATPDDVRCANREHGCPWVTENGEQYCRSCRLTRTRPSLDDPEIADEWRRAEAAKRRLVFQLERMGLDVQGATFDLLSSRDEQVITGHADGVITLDLAEADDVERIRIREQMDEPYRTLLGHFRHEIGHWLWTRYVDGSEVIEDFRRVFGDERADYGEALEAHYDADPPEGWADSYVSTYATAHPWEDFAETVAHWLHITDVLETAGAFGVSVDGPHEVLTSDPDDAEPDNDTMPELIQAWLPLTYALNAINRSMGHDDLYPFVLAPTVMSKLGWVHRRLTDVSA